MININIGTHVWELEIMDCCHCKLRLTGTEKWGFPLHVLQLNKEWLEQLREQNVVDSRFFL